MSDASQISKNTAAADGSNGVRKQGDDTSRVVTVYETRASASVCDMASAMDSDGDASRGRYKTAYQAFFFLVRA